MYQEGGIGGCQKEAVLRNDGDAGRRADGVRTMCGGGDIIYYNKEVF